MQPVRIPILAAAVAAMLGGCAVQPVAIDPTVEAERVKAEIAGLFAAQEPLSAPLSLQEAMARAVKYNLDQRVKVMEEALARGELAVARYDLMPALTAAAGYADRSNEAGASSESLLTGTESLEPSTSQEFPNQTANLGLTWNILDFGVSYLRAKQRADETLIAAEKRRKVVQNIIQDVRFAYWRAASAERLVPQMDEVLKHLDDALRRVDALEKTEILPPLTYLGYRKELLETRLEMWKVREELSSARAEFSALVNIPPGQAFRLAADPMQAGDPPQVRIPVEQMEQYALIYRPELRQEHYLTRISRLDVDKAMLRMLPGLELDLTGRYDGNKYLYNDQWTEAGLRVSWNLLNLISTPYRVESAEAKVAVDEARTHALAMAVVTQVRLALLRFETAREDFLISDALAQVEERIHKHMHAGQQADIENELQVIRTEADSLLARMNRDLALAEMQNAFGRVQNSIGLDPLPDTLADHELSTLSAAIGQQLADWERRAAGMGQ